MVKKKQSVARAECIVKFCDYVYEMQCQPLTRNEITSHYVACREAFRSGGPRWPSPAAFLFLISNHKSSGSNNSRYSKHLVCSICSRCLPDYGAFRCHLSDKEHVTCVRQLCASTAKIAESASAAAASLLRCPLPGCPEQLPDAAQLARHMSKKAHFLVYVGGTATVPAYDISGGDGAMPPNHEIVLASVQQYACLMCGRMFAMHRDVTQHEKVCEYREVFARERDALARGNDAIDISFSGVSPLAVEMQPDGAVQGLVQRGAASGQIVCTIRNTSSELFVLHSCTFNVKLCKSTMLWRDAIGTKLGGGCSISIVPGRSYDLELTASGFKSSGFYSGVLQLAFLRKVSDAKHVVIITPVNLRVVSADFQLLTPSEPCRSLPPLPTMSSTIYEGEPPERPTDSRLVFKVPLGKYEIPADIRDSARSRHSINAIRMPLASENYVQKFSKLLYYEEVQMEKDITRYTIRNTTMSKQGLLLELEVPGLAEKRPSVLRGDSVLVAVLGSDFQPEPAQSYRGYVHKVELNSVKIRFHERLLTRFVHGMRFMVEFSFNRLPMRLSHRAIEMAGREPMLLEVLFPKPLDTWLVSTRHLMLLNLGQARFFNQCIERNVEQARAVKAIVGGLSVPAPYLIFGPPGTGKTMTMVEAIKQVYFHSRDNYILTCAPQNEAADLLAERLLEHIPQHDIIRFNAASRQKNEICFPKVAAISNYGTDGTVVFPSTEELKKKRIIVSTVVNAGRLVSGGIGRSVFSHIFIDECGHCIEPEAVIPITGLLKVDDGLVTGQLVLAGDPKQLGPVIRSNLASQHGLGLSLLERLMKDREVYQRNADSGSYDNDVLTKLVNNYRSHQDILHIPNDIFYDNELKVCADLVERTKFCKWSELPCSDFPIVIHGIHGKDEQEGDSPSFFNKDEAVCVAEYAQKVLESRSPRVKPEHVGIIAPYRKQVQKIRELLRAKDSKASPNLGLSGIKVGSVEEFQGQERPVIIISTVRSTNPDYMKLDVEYNLGFLKNSKRFNVAVTRAKSLLIVVGNPDLLVKDDSWKRFLEYCTRRGGVTPAHMFASLFAEGTSVDTDDSSDEGGDGGGDAPVAQLGVDGISMVQGVNDPEWRGHL